MSLGAIGCMAEPAAQLPEPPSCNSTEDCPDNATLQLLVVDRGADAVIAYRSDGTPQGVLASATSHHLDRPSVLRRGPGDRYLLANYGDGSIVALDDGQQPFFLHPLLEEPVELLSFQDHLLILGNDTHNVVEVDAGGQFVREFGYPTMRHGHDFAFGPDGLLYVATTHVPHLDAAIQVWDPHAGELQGAFASAELVDDAISLSFAYDGTLYVADTVRGSVLHFDRLGTLLDTVAPEGTFVQLASIDTGPSRELYVVDRQGVHRLNPEDGSIRTLIKPGEGGLVRPRSLELAARSNPPR